MQVAHTEDPRQLRISGTDDVIIFQPNQLLMTRQKMSLVEKRIMFLILHHIKPNQSPEPGKTVSYSVQIPKAREKCRNPNWTNWMEALQKLPERVFTKVEVEDGDLDRLKFNGKPFFTEVDYKSSSGILRVDLNPKLNEAFLNLTYGYTKQMLESCLNLRGIHSLSLYNLICRYDYGRKFEIEWLKKYLDVEGKYENFSDFKKRILEAAKKDIDEHSDYIMHYEIVEKIRKRVVAIKLWGTAKEDRSNLEPEDIETIKEHMDKLGIKDAFHRSYILADPEAYMAACKKATEMNRVKKIQNPAGYILKIMGLVNGIEQKERPLKDLSNTN